MPLVLQISFLTIPIQIGGNQSNKGVLFKMGFFRYSLAVVRWLKRNLYLLVRVVSYARQSIVHLKQAGKFCKRTVSKFRRFFGRLVSSTVQAKVSHNITALISLLIVS